MSWGCCFFGLFFGGWSVERASLERLGLFDDAMPVLVDMSACSWTTCRELRRGAICMKRDLERGRREDFKISAKMLNEFQICWTDRVISYFYQYKCVRNSSSTHRSSFKWAYSWHLMRVERRPNLQNFWEINNSNSLLSFFEHLEHE